MADRTEYEVGIIGGGPAGSAMASYLARAGVRCIVLESEKFPRPHVGESLVPSSYRVFNELGFLQKMEDAGFPRKYGAAWTAAGAKGKAQIHFNERAQPDVEQDYTYHVDRSKFDLLLLDHARQLGAQVREEVNVTDVDFSGPDPLIRYKADGKNSSVSVKIVVDASGRRTLLGNQLRLKVKDSVFDQYAIHSWFENYDRTTTLTEDPKGDFIYVHFLPISNTWIWQIPITESITSVGLVTQRKNIAKTKEERETFFWKSFSHRPELYEKLKASKQLHPFKDEGDYSYAMNQIIGDRFLLIGDAARFVDPIFSTGVSIALNSARFASRDVIAALKSGNLGRESYTTYEATIRRGTKTWYEFISVYYRLNVLFTSFVNDPLYRLDILKLLQGDVYDEEEPAVLAQMREIVSEVERDKSHIWHSLLGDLTAGAFSPKF